MKKNCLVWVALLVAGISTTVSAQSSTSVPPVSGFWVVESNIHSKQEQIVRFYTDANELMYEEKVSRVKLNIKRARVQKRLNQALRLTLTRWVATRKLESNEHFVAGLFGK